MHLVLKWCSFPFLPSVRKANLTEDPLWNASSLGFLQGRGDLIWSWHACGLPALPCPVGGQPNDQERIRGFHTHRPHHTEWRLARLTHRNSHVCYSHSFWQKAVIRTEGKMARHPEGRGDPYAASSPAQYLWEGHGRAHPAATWHLLEHRKGSKEHTSVS